MSRIKIKLDNREHTDDADVLVFASWRDVQHEKWILGSHWEHDNDFAYAIISDEPGLVKKLRVDGYKVDATDYTPHTVAELEEIAKRELREEG